MGKKGLLSILLIILCIVLQGCDSQYYISEKGVYYYKPIETWTELDWRLYYGTFTEAINSLIFAKGKSSDKNNRPNLVLLEEDEYGRVLFFYSESSYSKFQSYLIAQKIDDERVYYYEDLNFILLKDYKQIFGTIDDLKEKNDWNKEINLAKCINKQIIEAKQNNINNKKIKSSLESYYTSLEIVDAEYITSNNNGLTIVYVCISIDDANRELIIITDNKYKLSDECIIEIDDNNRYYYQEKLKEFKEKNDWYLNAEDSILTGE